MKRNTRNSFILFLLSTIKIEWCTKRKKKILKNNKKKMAMTEWKELSYVTHDATYTNYTS